MIRKFGLRNFKGHRDTQLEFGRFTMLVGDNASGKTSVLDALALQASLGVDPRSVLRGSAVGDLLRRGSSGPIVFATEGMRRFEAWQMNFAFEIQTKSPGNAQEHWTIVFDGALGQRAWSSRLYKDHDDDDDDPVWDALHRASESLGSAACYRLRPEQIAAAAYSADVRARIDEDGTNTAVALAAMKLGDDEAFQRVEDGLRKLIPAVERVRIRPATVQRPGSDEVVGSKLYFDFRGAPGVPAHGASHGTLIVLALLAVLHGSSRPDLILLDDFDHALHPRAQMDLVRMIKQLLTLDEFKDVQVVATTHSPYMLDELEPSDVQVFALRDDGTVASKRLSEHPDAERTRGALASGQLWSLDPERNWVLRG
jgi:predicted ATPase